MAKIPTFTAEGSITQLEGTTSNVRMGLNQNLASALAPITKTVVQQKVKENALQNQAEALKLENDFITDMQSVTQTINTDEKYATNKDAANIYLKEQSDALIKKYRALATNGNVQDKFSNYALAEVQKTIFKTDTIISRNILTNLTNEYLKQKELVIINGMTNDIDRLTLQTSLEKLTIDTYSSQVSPPELKKMLNAIPVEIQLYDGLKDVQQTPRKTYFLLKDPKYLPDLSYEQRLKLEEKAKTIIRPQITTEWENYTAMIMAGKEPPAFNMELAKEIMTEPVANKMLQEESILKDTVIYNNLILTSSNKDLNELYEGIIVKAYEENTELKAQALEEHYQKILKKRINGLSKDPVSFIYQTNNSDIADLLSELEELKGISEGAGPIFNSDEEALAIQQKNMELASALADEQTKLGIPESQHKFMTNEQATGFVNSYIALAEKNDQKGMQNLMLTLGNEYGIYESKVIAQLKASGLPEGAEIALSLGNSELAVEALSLDTKEEKDSLKTFLKRETGDDVKFDDIKLMISEQMIDFEAILRKNVPLDSSDTLPEMDKLIDFLSYAAINRMYGKGMNAEKAAQSAANTFLNNFHLEDTYFIPKIYDGKDISANIDGIIDKADVLKDYYLPEFGAVAFKSATERDEVKLTNKMKYQMQTNGQWRNTPDGEGLVFGIVFPNGSFAPVINEKGEELTFKFNDTTYTIPGTSENFNMNLKYNEDTENVYAMGGAIKVDLEPIVKKEEKQELFDSNEISALIDKSKEKTTNVAEKKENKNLIKNWNKYYQTDDSFFGSMKAKERLNRMNEPGYKIPNDAISAIESAATNFDGDGGFSKKYLIDALTKIGQIESQYKTKVQKTDKPVKEETKFLARSYWQIEVDTAKDLLENSAPIFGSNFESSFSDYAKDGKSARQSLLNLSDRALVNLLEKDDKLAANIAAALIVTRFK